MQRQRIRRLSRRLLTSITFLVVFTISVSVFGEFFIKLAEENGWYVNPTARVGAVVTALSDFFTQTWVLVTAAFMVGLTIGLWLDSLLRSTQGLDAVETTDVSEPGMLDYIIEGQAAANKITKIFNRLGNDASRLGRTMSFYIHLIPAAQNNFTLRRWLANRVAQKLLRFSDRMRRDTHSIREAKETIQNTYVPWVEGILACPCGCEERIDVNLMRSRTPRWTLAITKDSASLHPSLWMSREKCGSHFWLRENRIVWTPDEIEFSPHRELPGVRDE